MFNLLSGKKEIILTVDLNVTNTSKDWYSLVKPELDLIVKDL